MIVNINVLLRIIFTIIFFFYYLNINNFLYYLYMSIINYFSNVCIFLIINYLRYVHKTIFFICIKPSEKAIPVFFKCKFHWAEIIQQIPLLLGRRLTMDEFFFVKKKNYNPEIDKYAYKSIKDYLIDIKLSVMLS